MSKVIIGRAERIGFPELNITGIPARIDTGAKTSSIWATGVKRHGDELEFVLFGKASPYYTGSKISVKEFDLISIASSTGHVQDRYAVKLLISVGGKKIRTTFTLANRSKQVYPVLIGRRVLTGKFLVDVQIGDILKSEESTRSRALQGRKLRKK